MNESLTFETSSTKSLFINDLFMLVNEFFIHTFRFIGSRFTHFPGHTKTDLARPGLARPGQAVPGQARPCPSMLGQAIFAKLGLARTDQAWPDMARPGQVKRGLVWHCELYDQHAKHSPCFCIHA